MTLVHRRLCAEGMASHYVCVFLLLIAQRAADKIPCESTDSLLLVSRHDSGTKVIVTDDKGRVVSAVTVEGHLLPADCEQKESCRNLTVLDRSQAYQYVVLIPGASSVLLLDIRLTGQVFSINDYYRRDVAGCDEVGAHMLRNSVFVSCLRAAWNRLSFMLFHLNASDFKSSTLSAPVSDFPYVQDQISNFIRVTLGSTPDAEQIYFQTGPYLYYCTPLSYTCYTDPVALPDCPRLYRLVYPGGNTIMLYCEEAFVVYVDIQEWAVLNVTSIVDYGQPYLCADRNVRLALFKGSSNYVQYGTWSQGSSNRNVTLRGHNFDSGACVQANHTTFFVYVDKLDGVYVTDVVNQSSHLLVEGECLTNSSFNRLRTLFEDQLLINEMGCGRVELFAFTQNTIKTFEVGHMETITELVLKPLTDGNCSIDQGLSTEPVDSESKLLKIAVPSVVIAILVIAILVSSITGFRLCHKNWKQQPPFPVQEETEMTDFSRREDHPEEGEEEERLDLRDTIYLPPIQETNGETNSNSGQGPLPTYFSLSLVMRQQHRCQSIWHPRGR